MRLLTERLVMRTPDKGDAGDIFRIMSDGKLAERTGFKRMSNVSEAVGKIRGVRPDGNGFFVVENLWGNALEPELYCFARSFGVLSLYNGFLK